VARCTCTAAASGVKHLNWLLLRRDTASAPAPDNPSRRISCTTLFKHIIELIERGFQSPPRSVAQQTASSPRRATSGPRSARRPRPPRPTRRRRSRCCAHGPTPTRRWVGRHFSVRTPPWGLMHAPLASLTAPDQHGSPRAGDGSSLRDPRAAPEDSLTSQLPAGPPAIGRCDSLIGM
jgi:hypothetical protein